MMTDNKVIAFAPIQGQTDFIYRKLHQEIFGEVDVYYSPFVRMLNDKTIRNKDKRDIDPTLNDTEHFVPQILGCRKEDMKLLLDYVESLGYKRVDVNFGCSYSMIAKHCQGAGLLKMEERSKIEELFKLIDSTSQLDISIKMRLGWSTPEESLSLLPLINETRLHSVTVHARLGIQEYEGDCDIDSFKSFHDGCKQKLIYNGDIYTVDDYTRIVNDYPDLTGIMIGRGMLANPSLARDIKNTIHGKALTDNHKRQLRQFHDALLAAYSQKLQGDSQIIQKMRTFWEYFMPGTDRKLLKKIKKATKLIAYNEAINLIFADKN